MWRKGSEGAGAAEEEEGDQTVVGVWLELLAEVEGEAETTGGEGL